MYKNKLLNVLLLIGLLAGFNALADTMKLDANGTLHKIEVIHHNGSSESNPKTYLAHILQKGDGTIERRRNRYYIRNENNGREVVISFRQNQTTWHIKFSQPVLKDSPAFMHMHEG